MIREFKEKLRFAHRGYKTLCYSTFGTTAHPRFLLKEMIRKRACKLGPIREISEANKGYIEELRKNGGVSIPNFFDREMILRLKRDYDASMSHKENIIEHHFSTVNILPAMKISPIFKDIIHSVELKNFLVPYYGADFIPYAFDCHRSNHIPLECQSAEKLLAATWHNDNHPTDFLRIIINLQDMEVEDGPTHMLTIPRTKEILRRGFYQRNNYGLPINIIEDPQHLKRFTGPMQTAHFVLPGRVLHRAGVPAEGHKRDVIIISFRPVLASEKIQNLGPIKRRFYYLGLRLSENKEAPAQSARFVGI